MLGLFLNYAIGTLTRAGAGDSRMPLGAVRKMAGC